MAIVKKRREAKVGLKPGYTLNGEIKEQQQDDNEVKYSNKKMEVTETYHQNGVIDNYHKKINEFKAVKSRENSKHKRVTNGAISLINTKSGKRLIMAKLLSSNLNNPSKVVIGLSKNKLAIGEKLPANENYFTVKDYKGKRVIYSADLVKHPQDLAFDLETMHGGISLILPHLHLHIHFIELSDSSTITSTTVSQLNSLPIKSDFHSSNV